MSQTSVPDLAERRRSRVINLEHPESTPDEEALLWRSLAPAAEPSDPKAKAPARERCHPGTGG